MSRTDAGHLRYVALGDSQTEGLGDGDDLTGLRGWADRLAENLARRSPELRYANLAVRGRLAREVRDGQLAPALALEPDLATVVAGVNDLMRPRFDADEVAGHLEAMFSALTAQGALVATLTFPDLTLLIPLARPLSSRVTALNARIRDAARRHGVVVAETSGHPVVTDPRLWSVDRLHAGPLGHQLIADAVAHALALPGSDDSWTSPLPLEGLPAAGRRTVGGELRWAGTFLGPWLGRRLLGRSSGDGRTAKRPQLLPVRPPQDGASEADPPLSQGPLDEGPLDEGRLSPGRRTASPSP
ncbi:SGNH/GDSL hydrolase family protein [Planotetraspora kaengkrachanensis]|uniref:Lysophospholipase n=1 Tax=Planotetraspora kaengkrachanensis TaxID=575193 RepID=A0A8J3M3X8_9ACTN|nr:SGNH/GDSL hydrolase family protein [Planotetraspora kaengkrachanensis]GIG78730.1 lysophospholipase [Planotetraspora kaengkrachanensis]